METLKHSGQWLKARAVLALGLAFAAAALVISPLARADRLRDIASVQGVRANQLIGYGLVVGLDGSGDQTTQTPFTTQSLSNMLQQLGITLPRVAVCNCATWPRSATAR